MCVTATHIFFLRVFLTATRIPLFFLTGRLAAL
jgi:hypothetical protein